MINPRIPATEADRDLFIYLLGLDAVDDEKSLASIRQGDFDHWSKMQAIVRHRLAHQPSVKAAGSDEATPPCSEIASQPQPTRDESGLREAVAIWSGEHRAYWRRGPRGEGANYTTNLDAVGVWQRCDAERLTSHCGPER